MSSSPERLPDVLLTDVGADWLVLNRDGDTALAGALRRRFQWAGDPETTSGAAPASSVFANFAPPD